MKILWTACKFKFFRVEDVKKKKERKKKHIVWEYWWQDYKMLWYYKMAVIFNVLLNKN